MQNLNGRTFEVEAYGERIPVQVAVSKYAKGERKCIVLLTIADTEVYGILTINIPEANLHPDEILVKTWSENAPLAKAAMETGWFEDTKKVIPTGFVFAEIWKIL